VAALFLGLVGAGASQAAITSTSITSPADPTFVLDTAGNITVSGTTNSTAPGTDQVDIDCYVDNGSTNTSEQNVVPDVPLNGSGAFSVSVSPANISTVDAQPECRLRAVPAGTTPTTGLSAFAGPRVGSDVVETDQSGAITSGPNAGVVYDYYIEALQIGGGDDYESLGGFGLDDSYLMDPSTFGQIDSVGFYGNDWLDNPTDSSSGRSGALVDGQNAYAPAEAKTINDQASGFPAVSVTPTITNASTGDLTINESEPLVECPGNPFPANSGNCTAFTPSGVQDQRTITQTDNGHIVLMDDRYSSTNGQAHTLSLELEQDQHFEPPMTTQTAAVLSYEFPGQSVFGSHVSGDLVSVPAGTPASILIENNAQPDGSTSGGRAAITYGTAPSGPFSFLASDPADFDAPVVLSVPASGSIDLRYAYSTEYTTAAVNSDVLAADDMIQPPAISITSPASTQTIPHLPANLLSTPVTVSGSVSAGSGIRSVTVNGVAATVANGTFSAAVPLTLGANSLIAVATSNAGNSANDVEAVTYMPPPPSIDLAKSSISSKKKKQSATFTFTANGVSTGYECALVKEPKTTKHRKHHKHHKAPTPSYSSCTSPKAYKHLAKASYEFYVEAVGPGGTSTPATHKFKIT
jgi:hypothetical protein